MKTIKRLGFTHSHLLPGVYVNKLTGTLVVAHVGDLLCLGSPSHLKRFREDLMRVYECKYQVLERGTHITYLGRTIGLDEEGYTWKADRTHVKTLLEEQHLTDCASVNSPYWDDFGGKRPNSKELSRADATNFRRAVAKISYLRQDRFDLAVRANMLSRYMANPREG